MKGATTTAKRFLRRATLFLPAAAVASAVAFSVATLSPEGPRCRPVDFPGDASWITTTGNEGGSSGVFRFDFELAQDARRAWVAVAADGGFELLVNSNPSAAFYLWRATRPFQTGLSEFGQRRRAKPAALGLNFPREHQWTGHENYRVPVYADITPDLRRGANCLCVEIESRHGRPSFALQGAVELASGEIVPLSSSPAWRAAPVPFPYRQGEWTDPERKVDAWEFASAAKPPVTDHYSLAPRDGFADAFQGEWLQISPGLEGRQTFAGKWTVTGRPDRAYLRVLATAPYYLEINGKSIVPKAGKTACFGSGEWNVQTAGRRQLAVQPERLDDDETSDLFVGTAFENPSHGDPTDNAFREFSNELNRSRDRPSQAGGPTRLDLIEEQKKREKGAIERGDPLAEEADSRVPLVLTSPKMDADFFLYEIGGFLREGDNDIELTLVAEDVPGYPAAWRPKFALDGKATTAGAGEFPIRTSAGNWTRDGEPVKATMPAPGDHLLQLKFLQTNSAPSSIIWRNAGGGVFLGLAGLTLLAMRSPRGRAPRILRRLVVPAAAFVLWLGLFWLLGMAFRERSEALFIEQAGWRWLALGYGVVLSLGIGMRGALPGDGAKIKPRRGLWVPLLAGIVLLTFALRAWKIDHQPIDDDEYASVQAALSIAETGVPAFAEGVWYTRSPAYHYAAGAVAWLFGKSVVAIRLLSVLQAVATALVVYFLGSRVLDSRATGAIAAVLFALHPFCIFTGHIARFYQQQQLFVLVALYLFIRGFIQGGPPVMRLLTAGALALAVLSQEISVAMLPAFGLCYLLLGRSRPFRQDFAVAVAAGIALAWIALDIAFFKLKCMTPPTGVSPNVEATLKPHFWEPMNLFSMLIGYSRLHVVASVFALWGTAAGLMRRQAGICAIAMFLGLAILTTNLLVTSVSFRYQYALIPLFLVLAAHGIRELAALVSSGDSVARRGIGAICMGAVILSWSPWRIPGSYDEKQLGDSTGALQYVRRNLRDSDRIMITEPHPHAALLELGRVDYDLAVPILYDFTHRRDGRLVDRNAGAEAVGHLGKMQSIFGRCDRLWILVNREKFKTRGRNLRWEYPGARLDSFLRQNCDLRHRGYLWDVYLWDAGVGKYQPFRQLSDSWID